MRKCQFDVIDLTISRRACDLLYRFHQRKQAVHPGMYAGETAAIGIDRQFPAGRDAPALDKPAALPLGAETEIFKEQDRVDRKGVIELNDVDVFRRHAGKGVCASTRSRGTAAGQKTEEGR